MEEESCKTQKEIYKQSMENCEGGLMDGTKHPSILTRTKTTYTYIVSMMKDGKVRSVVFVVFFL